MPAGTEEREQIKVTEAMIEAGLYELELCIATQVSPREHVTRLYREMETQGRLNED